MSGMHLFLLTSAVKLFSVSGISQWDCVRKKVHFHTFEQGLCLSVVLSCSSLSVIRQEIAWSGANWEQGSYGDVKFNLLLYF